MFEILTKNKTCLNLPCLGTDIISKVSFPFGNDGSVLDPAISHKNLYDTCIACNAVS